MLAWWWAPAGPGREPQPAGAGTAQLGLGGAVSASGSAAWAEPPRLLASGRREGAAALRLAELPRTRGRSARSELAPARLWRPTLSPRAGARLRQGSAGCAPRGRARLGEGIRPRAALSAVDLSVFFSNPSANVCPKSADVKSPSNPARGCRGKHLVTVGFRLPGSFMAHQTSSFLPELWSPALYRAYTRGGRGS